MTGRSDAKYIKIAEELISKLKRGELQLKDEFYSREEIAEQYGISPLTAYKVLRYIESKKWIVCGRGHRAKICKDELEKIPKTAKRQKIAIFYYQACDESPIQAKYWLLEYLTVKLKADGNQVTPLSMNHWETTEKEKYTGIILLEIIDIAHQYYNELKQGNIPFVAISFQYLAPNLLCIMPRYYIMQISLYMMRHKISTVLFFQSSNSELERYMSNRVNTHLESFFGNHQYPVRFMKMPLIDITANNAEEQIRKILSSFNNEQIGIIARNPYIAEKIHQIMIKKGKSYPKDFLLVTYGFVPEKQKIFSYVDFKLEESANNILAMLYRQINNNTIYDLGALSLPEFVEI